MPSYGFYIRNANDIFFNDIVLETEGVDYRPALSIVKSDNVFLNNTYIHMNERADSHIHIQQSENIHINSPAKSSGIKGNKSQWQLYK